jgi:GNAT superfamily N-acetyltransferase
MVTCDECDHEFHVSNQPTEPCPASKCDGCGDTIAFIQENRSLRGKFETYHCYQCGVDIGVQTPNGPIGTETVLETDWLLDGRTLNQAWDSFGGSYWFTQATEDREKAAVASLNIEAENSHPSFNPYNPDSTKAHLCGTDEYCVGYITWDNSHAEPELGQLYILPEFRRQGIGQGFVAAWRDDVASPLTKIRVNNPNSDMYRLLRSMDLIKITKTGLDFPGCIITGTKVDIPGEWGPHMA